jgi:serine/threonine protein kinase
VACIGENTIVAWVDGSLAEDERVGVEAHVAGCPHCRAVLSEVGRSSLVDGAIPAAAPAGGAVADGTVLAERYRITRFIARGGMGEVYEAEDLELHAPVALKMMRAEMAADPGAIARFKRETHLARRVTHPNVCRIFDVGFVASEPANLRVPFLTMELLAGETLSEWLLRIVRLTPEEALPLAGQLAAALQAAHDAGVVHRDFKSANIVLVPTREEGGLRAVVTDFGVARASDGLDFAATHSSARGIVGSPGYMAPEQLQGGEATAAADVYAYGVVLYEMVTGHLPFEEKTALLTALKRLEHPPTSPRVHVPELDVVWERVLLRCLARETEARFASVADAYQALGGGAATRFAMPSVARLPHKGARGHAAAPSPWAPTVAAPGARHARTWLALAVAALSSLVVAGVAWKRHPTAHAQTTTPPAPPASTTVPRVTPTPATPPPAIAKAPVNAQLPAAATATSPPAAAATIVRSEPPGARVLVDGQLAGTTPLTLTNAPPFTLQLSLPGYRTIRRHVTATGSVQLRLVTLPATPANRLLDE